MQVPVLAMRHVLTKVAPPATSVLSGMVTSATNDALLVHPATLVAWLLAGVQDRGLLIASLRRAADAYRRHANWALRWLSVYLPLWLTVAVGGTAVLLYAVSVFGPWCWMLYELSALPSAAV